MQFQLTPILDQMEALYKLPRDRNRFDRYLAMLQGPDKEDMVLPIAAYNPMAKEDALKKLQALQQLDAESIAREVITDFNKELESRPPRTISVVLNLADDIGGSWSSRYTTDYTSKFDFGPILKRNFCTPYFWTREDYSAESIRQRITEQLHRTIYFADHGKPATLAEHIAQEVYVIANNGASMSEKPNPDVHHFYQQHCDSEDYALIFNFFYGDRASEHLNFKSFGMPAMGGFHYTKAIAE